MVSSDRRLGFRVPLQIFLNQYIQERPFRGLTTDLSDSGLYLESVAASHLPGDAQVVGLEFELPETGEIIWARGEIARERGGLLVRGAGIRFTAMARGHARLLRDFCIEARRRRLSTMLERIRNPVGATNPAAV